VILNFGGRSALKTNLNRLGLLALAAMIALPKTGLAQKLPPGPLLDRPSANERETVQAGGHGWGNYSQVGNLRCQGSREAIVGFRIRRGSALDYLQIACAAINCVGAKCGWTSYLSEGSAGNPSGGQVASQLLCRTDEALSGYRATVKKYEVPGVKVEYVDDVEIQCAKISGLGSAENPRAVRVLPDGRTWRHAGGNLSAKFGSYLNPPGVCPSTSASAVSFAVGHYGITAAMPLVPRTNVVQAMSLFCGAAQTACPAGTSTNFEPLASLYGRTPRSCPECCKQCVGLQGSTNPITGRTDIEVANLPVQRYNCHLYTLSYMNYVTPPIPKGRVPRQYDRTNIFGTDWELAGTSLRATDMQKYGWTPVNPSGVRPGDIVTFGPASKYEHSAIVIRSGNPAVLRQKPNPYACVTDFTWQEALTFYSARPVTVWRR
jgi:hypothetical protein